MEEVGKESDSGVSLASEDENNEKDERKNNKKDSGLPVD